MLLLARLVRQNARDQLEVLLFPHLPTTAAVLLERRPRRRNHLRRRRRGLGVDRRQRVIQDPDLVHDGPHGLDLGRVRRHGRSPLCRTLDRIEGASLSKHLGVGLVERDRLMKVGVLRKVVYQIEQVPPTTTPPQLLQILSGEVGGEVVLKCIAVSANQIDQPFFVELSPTP